MSTGVFLVVLAAAALHAMWNALVKHGGDPLFRLAITALTGTAIALPMLPFVGLPAIASWPWLLGSIVTHVVYYTTLAMAYRTGDLSIVYPVARGSAPPLVALGGLWLAGERLDPAGIAAIALICAGILVLVLIGGARSGSRESFVAAMLCSASIAVYTVCDGLGVRSSGDAAGYIVWLFFLDGLAFGVAVLWLRRGRLRRDLARGVGPAMLGGALSMLAYGLVVWALHTTPMGLVSALRETSVVLAAIIGTRLLGEPFGGRRVASAILVAAGVMALKLA